MLLFIIVACFLAKLRGYRLRPMLSEWSLYPLAFVEILFWVAQICAWNGIYHFVPYASRIQSAFIVALLFPIFRFRLYRTACAGAGMTLLGSLLNRWVMNANGGRMPVLPTLSRWTGYYREGAMEVASDGLHMLMSDQTRLNWLADWIDVGFSIMSIGDLLIHGFVLIVVYQAIRALNRGIEHG